MKLSNESKRVEYGVMATEGYCRLMKGRKAGRLCVVGKRPQDFRAFANCAQATKSIGARVVRHVTWTTYDFDE